MKNWKFKYFETDIKESHAHIFSSLEIENYIQKFLSNYELTLNNCQINYLNSTVYIIISIYNTKQKKEHKQEKILEKERKSKTTRTLLANNLGTLYFSSTNRPFELNEFFNSTSFVLNPTVFKKKDVVKKNEYLRLKKQYKNFKSYYLTFKNIHKKKLELNTNRTFKLNNFSKKLLEGIKSFLGNKYKIVMILEKQNLTSESTLEKYNVKLKLRRFQRANFFSQGTSILFTFISKIGSEKLLIEFIAKELASTKRHKFFLNFVKESFNILINQNFSKISGIKLVVKGRLNNVMRANSYTIKMGKIPLIAPCPSLTYSETTAYSKNGTLGIKIWVLRKPL